MSNQSNGPNFSGVDNLTPFEYALAGVPVADPHDSPSLAVIDQMRRLLSDVEDARVVQPRLREFLETGGSIARRSDRRSLRRRRPTGPTVIDLDDIPAEGGFIDITPEELTAADVGAEPTDEHPAIAIDTPIDTATDTPIDTPIDTATDTPIDTPIDTVIDTAIDTAASPSVVEPPAPEMPAPPASPSVVEPPAPEMPAPPAILSLPEELVPGAAVAEPALPEQPEPVAEPALPEQPEPVAEPALPEEPEPVAETALPEEPEPVAEPAVPEEPVPGAAVAETAVPEEPVPGAAVAETAVGGAVAAALGGPTDEDRELFDLDAFDTSELDAVQAALQAELPDDDTADDPRNDTPSDPADEPEPEPDDVIVGHRDHGEPLDDERPLLFPEVPDAVGDGRDLAGRFTGHQILGAEAALGADDDPIEAEGPGPNEDAILVGAAGSQLRGILDQGTAAETPLGDDRHELTGVPALVAAAPEPRRLPGGRFWALAATAAAAAALAIGGLWWADRLGDGSGTETAGIVVDDRTEVSTATGDPASAAGGEDDADGSQTTEFDRRTSTTALATTSRGDDATVTPSSTDPPATSSTATIGSTETTAPPTSEPTTEAPTTAPTTTAASQETTEPTVARPAEAPALAGIGDAVTLDSASGPGVGAVRVSLYADPDGDGEGDSLQQSTTTSTAGRYAFTPTPGCYVIQFSAPDGYRVEPDDERQVVCLQPGQAVSDVDAVVYRVRPPSPSGCFVEKAGGSRRGVEVFEDDGAWAPSYTFYDKDGEVVVRTRDIGPADDVEGPTNHEWHGEANGFDHRDVRSVAAERNGLESQPVTCDR